MEFWTVLVNKFVEFWTELADQFNQAFITGDRWLLFTKGLGVTLLVTVFALVLGVFLGVFIAIIRTAHDQRQIGRSNPVLSVLNVICKIYITVIRGTPMMVQMLIMYFVIFASSRNMVGVAVLAFGINSGAYVSEIIRGGIMAVDVGQMEAGRSLGFGYASTMRLIIIPQAVKIILPALGNELITLLKETSIVTVIGLKDLVKQAIAVQAITYQPFMPLIGIAVIYLALVMLLTWLFGRLERRLRTSER